MLVTTFHALDTSTCYILAVCYRTMQKHPDSEMAKFAEYCLKTMQTLQRTKKRDYIPSRNEVIACYVRVCVCVKGFLPHN